MTWLKMPNLQSVAVMALPTVSIITPTYCRAAFIPQMLRCVRLQDYPQHLIEVVILDDSPEPLVLQQDWKTGLNVRLHRSASRIPLGEKRNRLNRFADGQIIVAFDDDDYYPATRVSHAVQTLQASECKIAGSTVMLIWHVRNGALVAAGPYHPNHSCNGAFAYTRGYGRRHAYDRTAMLGEEPAFTRNFTEPMAQLDPVKTMLAIAHQANTVPKMMEGDRHCVLPNPLRFPGLTRNSWLDFVPDEESRAFYRAMFGAIPDRSGLFPKGAE